MPDPVPRQSSQGSLFAVLRHPAFRWIWIGALVSNVGNWMETVAQGWLVEQQTHSALWVEMLAAAEFIPAAFLTLSAGVLADRYNRQRLLLIGQVAMMVFAAVLAALAHLHLATPPVVVGLALLEGAAWVLVMPAWQALMPAMVPRDELPKAIALNSAQFNTARLLGPMLAGVMLTASGAPLVFDVNVASFLGIVAILTLVTVPGARLAQVQTTGGELVKSGGVGEALAWAIREKGPRRLVLGIFAFAFFSAPLQGLLPLYADAVLHVGAHGYGVLLGCLGAGAITGALSLTRLTASYPRHHLIPLAMLAFALCAVTMSGSHHMLLSSAAMCVAGVFWVWALAASTTAMQLLVPERLRGRGMSVLALANIGMLPAGHIMGGLLAHAIGPRLALGLMSSGLATFATWSSISREPAIDKMNPALAPPRGLRGALWETLSAASHRAQGLQSGPGNAEPLEE